MNSGKPLSYNMKNIIINIPTPLSKMFISVNQTLIILYFHKHNKS